MMALVSELSMNQATAMKLQQEVKGKEQELEQCYVRMERGEAPSEEAERGWYRMIRDEDRRNKELMEKKEVWGRLKVHKNLFSCRFPFTQPV